jgi:hypothetical protein
MRNLLEKDLKHRTANDMCHTLARLEKNGTIGSTRKVWPSGRGAMI